MKAVPPILSPRSFALQLLGTFFLLAAIKAFSYWISSAYQQAVPARVETLQSNYSRSINEFRATAPLIAELGKQGALLSWLKRTPGPSLELQGFQPGESWNRTVSWSVRCPNECQIEIETPENAAYTLALYYSDGDSFWRTSYLSLAQQQQIAQELHNGRWLHISLPANQRRHTVRLRKLSGDDIALSALALIKTAS